MGYLGFGVLPVRVSGFGIAGCQIVGSGRALMEGALGVQGIWGVSETRGTLLGGPCFQETYHWGDYVRGPLFSETPCRNQFQGALLGLCLGDGGGGGGVFSASGLWLGTQTQE